MLPRVIVDFIRTCGGPGILLSVVAKTERKDPDDPQSDQAQSVDAEGTPKWTVGMACPGQGFNGDRYENLYITVVSKVKPLAAAPQGAHVVPEDLEMGIMKSEKGNITQFFSCKSVRVVTMQEPPAQR